VAGDGIDPAACRGRCPGRPRRPPTWRVTRSRCSSVALRSASGMRCMSSARPMTPSSATDLWAAMTNSMPGRLVETSRSPVVGSLARPDRRGRRTGPWSPGRLGPGMLPRCRPTAGGSRPGRRSSRGPGRRGRRPARRRWRSDRPPSPLPSSPSTPSRTPTGGLKPSSKPFGGCARSRSVACAGPPSGIDAPPGYRSVLCRLRRRRARRERESNPGEPGRTLLTPVVHLSRGVRDVD
jgi:hypothetical protein